MSILRLSLLGLLAACVCFAVLQFPQTSFSMLAGSLIALSTSSTVIFFSLAVMLLIMKIDRSSAYIIEQAEPAFVRRPHE